MKIYLNFVMDFEKQAYDGDLKMSEELKDLVTKENKNLFKERIYSLTKKIIDESIDKIHNNEGKMVS